jgi:predicted transcriptional regulator
MAKLTKDAILELESRRKIYNLITESPGLHFRELQRRLDIAYGKLQYHLEFMKKHGLIEEEKTEEYSRFYPSSFRSIVERDIMSLLRQKSIRHILLYLLENPGAQNKDIADATSLSPSTVSWHIGHLMQAKAVTQERKTNEACYYVNEPEVVIRLLTTYKTSFIDAIVDRYVELWEKESLKK